ncbi:hypothetical protein [Kitasatospora sp. NPDC050543]|uniref:hypothetical protein n=1 Tax=Kitasatospora sp. NPDC050543 TaxID=3364054 RepID=UPI0037B41064
MNSLIVLLELEPSTEFIDSDEIDIGARVRWVHAADPDPGGDPDAPRRPPARTLCGLDTTELEPEEYLPAGPGEPWYPPEHGTRRCRDCEAVVLSR